MRNLFGAAQTRRRSTKNQSRIPGGWIILVGTFLIALWLIIWSNHAFYEEFLREAKPLPEIPVQVQHDRNKELAWIELDSGNGRKRIFEGYLNGHSYSFLAVLNALRERSQLPISVKNGKIEHLSEPKGSWSIYRNGSKISGKIDALIVRAGDRYSIKREK